MESCHSAAATSFASCGGVRPARRSRSRPRSRSHASAARAAGLTLRPVADTVGAALTWERERGLRRDRRAGLTPPHEAKLVAAAE